MYKITRREVLVNNVYVFDVEAPAIARKARAGQFVILRVDDRGERIPVTIADYDREQGTVTIVFMAVGTTTRKLALMQEGESLPTFVGPLGNPTHVEDFGHDPRRLEQEIRITVLHELAHYFGIDEDRLDELGYG